jgi:hypothetical protein
MYLPLWNHANISKGRQELGSYGKYLLEAFTVYALSPKFQRAKNPNASISISGRVLITSCVVNLFAYYAIAMPISFGTGFGLKWGLIGLWSGPAIALFLVFAIESYIISKINWERSVEDAKMRNSMG